MEDIPPIREDHVFDDEVSQIKARNKVVALSSNVDVHEFEKPHKTEMDAVHRTTSSVSTAAPTEGTDSMGCSMASMLSFRPQGSATSQFNTALETIDGGSSSLSADAPAFRMTGSLLQQEAARSTPLSMEPLKITSIKQTPSAIASDGSAPTTTLGMGLLADLPSVGSKDHAAGLCKPCAWYWKPSSCLNGKECCHCHLCPAGEIKARKKGKALMAQGKDPGMAEPAFVRELLGPDEDEVRAKPTDAPQKTFSTSENSDSLFANPLLLMSTQEQSTASAIFAPVAELPSAFARSANSGPDGELMNRKKRLAKAPEGQDDLEGSAAMTDFGPTSTLGSISSEAEDSSVLLAPPGLPGPIPTSGSTSVGSDKHGTGECRPCAWYWKPGSCSNGKDCMHCHLCSEDEIKRRKKAKLASIRSSSKDSHGASKEAYADSKASLNAQKHRRSSRSPNPAKQKTRGDSSTPPPPAFNEMPQEGKPDSISGTEELDQADLPSSGSALHASGKCKPCAWFWKPGGCTNGKECCHCHVCPAEELKSRRKAKESAMRVGALVPKKAQVRALSANARAMHVLKIFPLI
jgi:hypothetical protein